jgi:heat shock protein HtpX
MDSVRIAQQKLHNSLQSAILVGLMSGLTAYIAWVIGGVLTAVLALVMILVTFALAPKISPRLVLRMFRGRILDPREAPQLYAILRELAERAGLDRIPRLFYVPSDVMNAFAVGDRSGAVIALSDGILRRMSLMETAAVLAHETSHVAHNDLRVMGFADIADRFTRVMSLFGQILLVINLPLLLIGAVTISWVPILLLIFAPTLSALAQRALSRTREYNADLGAARLLGDPRPMASALAKMERVQGSFLEQLLGPGQRLPDPSLLRTHPPTEERIRRLLELSESEAFRGRAERPLRVTLEPRHGPRLAHTPIPPRWHITGTWY